MSRASLGRRLVAEGIGTASLLLAVVGSGIMAERLAGGNIAIVLLANAVATGCALFTLILTFGAISGAHFNPVVTLSDSCQGGLMFREVPGYLVAQTVGSVAGVGIANLLFELPLFTLSTHVRAGTAQFISEIVATAGLLGVIWGTSRREPGTTPLAVATYITAAYWFTPSTSFANPAVTLARALTDTFAGIRPADVPWFVVAQVLGAAGGTLVMGWLTPDPPAIAPQVIARTSEAIP